MRLYRVAWESLSTGQLWRSSWLRTDFYAVTEANRINLHQRGVYRAWVEIAHS